ncbi:MAG TPA: hypothetical protein VG937_16155 [Polyangiaceae bacterium]|nr:hypothetical protein [Polyangiaceae bacterium]
MTASERRSPPHPSLTALLVWSFAPIFVAACGSGAEVDLGHVTLTGGTGGGSGGTGLCGSQPCADHRGTRVFVEESAKDRDADGFVTGNANPTGTDPGLEPVLLYPSHETMFPVNVAHVRFTWNAPEGALFALDFKGPNTEVRVVTAEPFWLASDEEWDWIAESNRGHDVTLELHAIEPAEPQEVWSSPPATFSFSREAVEGAIYYWSTGSQGVMKALLADPNPVKFYTDPEGGDAATCTGCHTLSRDGKRLAVGYGGLALRVVSVPERTVTVNGGTAGGADPMPGKMMPADKAAIPAAWTTFSPDGKRLLVAAGGKLTLLDSNTGMPVGSDAGVVTMPAGMIATHPDWSALGDQVALTLAEKGGDKSTEGGSIALLPYRGGTFGAPEVIVPKAPGMDNNYFPSFSPDSRYIAFVSGSGKSEDAKSASLRLVEVATRKVIELPRLNQRVNNQDGLTNLGNSMPTWAPSTTAGTFWLAFSSIRQYADLRPLDKKQDQIWIAAIDPTRADPSFAAFWAPFQSILQGNHRAFWTHTAEDRQCRCVDVCGDDIDNDCNGSADEAGCVSGCADREVCGDGIDNDCDCVIDDCSAEICTDGIDNDGDGRADADDPACAGQK